MARNYSLEITGNGTSVRDIDPNHLTIKVRTVTFEPDTPTTGTMYIEYLDAYGNWIAFNSGVLSFGSLYTAPPTAYITDELTTSVRVRTTGIPDTTIVKIDLFADYVGQSSLNPRLTTRNNQFSRIKTENISIGQQLVLDGFTVEWFWRIRAMAKNSKQFVKFTVPSGVYMVLQERMFQIEDGEAYFRVYAPSVVDTVGEVIGADVPIRSNFRNDSDLTLPSVANIVTLNTTPSPDDAFSETAVFTTGQGNSSSGELDNDEAFKMLSPDSVFYLEINNVGEISYNKVTFRFSLLREEFVQPPIAFD